MFKKKEILVDNIYYEVVATVYDDESDKNFIVYTSKDYHKNKGLKLFCTLYKEENDEYIPVRITSKEDKEIAEDIIIEVMNRLNIMR